MSVQPIPAVVSPIHYSGEYKVNICIRARESDINLLVWFKSSVIITPFSFDSTAWHISNYNANEFLRLPGSIP